MGSIGVPGSARQVVVSGGFAYVAESDFDAADPVLPSLIVVDVSDPTSPTQVSSFTIPHDQSFASDVAFRDNFVFYSDVRSFLGLFIFDVSDPTNPTQVGFHDCVGHCRGLALSGPYAYIFSDTVLVILDVSDPMNPTIVSSTGTPDFGNYLDVSGIYAYLANSFSGLSIYDISDPTNPTFVSTIDTPGQAIDVIVSGNYAYVSDWDQGLQIIDVSNPFNPTLVVSFNPHGQGNPNNKFQRIALSGNHLFVAAGNAKLLVIDISDPTNPTLADTKQHPGFAIGVFISGIYAYVTADVKGLHIIDVSEFVGAP